jgi:hypothetical protein
MGTILVRKTCSLVTGAPCLPTTQFPITVTGNNPRPYSLVLADGGTQLVMLRPVTYAISEQAPSNFVAIFSGNCIQVGPFEARGIIMANEHQTCTISNMQQAPPPPLPSPR